MDSSVPRPIALLRSALLPDGRSVDVAIDGATVSTVAPAGTLTAPAEETIDLGGRLLLTAPAEPHAHLDKALSADAIRPPLNRDIAIQPFDLAKGRFCQHCGCTPTHIASPGIQSFADLVVIA